MSWNVVFFLNSFLLGVGLAMDAFSVSLANGLNEPIMKKSKMILKIYRKILTTVDICGKIDKSKNIA